jgi:hypothetical protein
MYAVKLNEPNVLPCVEAIRVVEGSDVVGKVSEARTSGTGETGRQERVQRDAASQGRRAERVLCFDAFLQCSFPNSALSAGEEGASMNFDQSTNLNTTLTDVINGRHGTRISRTATETSLT